MNRHLILIKFFKILINNKVFFAIAIQKLHFYRDFSRLSCMIQYITSTRVDDSNVAAFIIGNIALFICLLFVDDHSFPFPIEVKSDSKIVVKFHTSFRKEKRKTRSRGG